MNTEMTPKSKKLEINRSGLKVIRLKLTSRGSIPEHATNADVVIVVLDGRGIFSINGKPNIVKRGDVFELRPGTHHSITAVTDLELIVNHMQLKSDSNNIACESESCSHD